MEEKKVLVESNSLNQFSINWFNSYKGITETHKFPAYKHGSKRKPQAEISEEFYHYLKDETSTFKEGYLRVVVNDELPEEKLDLQKEYEQEIVDTTPEYVETVITKEEIEKLMKGTAAKIKDRLSKVENTAQKQLIVEVVKELGIDSRTKLKAVAETLYGADADVDFLFPDDEN